MNVILRRLCRPSVAHTTHHSFASSTAEPTCDGLQLAAVCEQQLNRQVGRELSASHAYLGIAAHFARPSIAMPGCAGFFLLQSAEERRHAAGLIAYLNRRGGRVQLDAIPAIPADETALACGLEYTFQLAVDMELENLRSLRELHAEAQRQHDELLADFVSGEYLAQQVGVRV